MDGCLSNFSTRVRCEVSRANKMAPGDGTITAALAERVSEIVNR